MLIFKYLDELNEVNKHMKCPCDEAESVDLPAFRYASNSSTPEENFLPQSVKERNEGKKPRSFPPGAQVNCEYHGLSMFNTRDNAMKFWNGNLKPKTRKLLGYDILLKGPVEKHDGSITPISGNGHFNLYEYIGSNLSSKFNFLENLPE